MDNVLTVAQRVAKLKADRAAGVVADDTKEEGSWLVHATDAFKRKTSDMLDTYEVLAAERAKLSKELALQRKKDGCRW